MIEDLVEYPGHHQVDWSHFGHHLTVAMAVSAFVVGVPALRGRLRRSEPVVHEVVEVAA
jgi:hypothetical protein